ncbi:TetR family transcriptional regulator [Amnibacterium setariae]|uniref:TetR/AcrR family transcriptional regulator n=1 Tax=Amnibacterium setariae TaxID=2306585 RepID=A0A3A1TWR3_9MICO|nr:TetR family transcriptional regulator [Amnibacterium setariae]RIX28642.1 TetR/AcrR family transcriptional regulator [Amnibacterium setariae]
MADATRTRQRILDAATAEFAARGIAGARVDRIAETSGASKPMLYAYFGSKEQLFDAVFQDHVIGNSDRAPFAADDLPGYAVRLYDDYLTDPALLRLVMWKRLERVQQGYLYDGLEDNDARHLAAISDQQARGVIRSDISAEDVWSLLISTAATWAQGSLTVVATGDDAATVHLRRRAALEAVVRAGLTSRQRD